MFKRFSFEELFYLYLTSLVGSFAGQVYWAINHTTIGLGRRILFSTVGGFILLSLILGGYKLFRTTVTENVGVKLGLSLLAICTSMIYLVIFNPWIKLAMLMVHFALVVQYICTLFEVSWFLADVNACGNVVKKMFKRWFGPKVAVQVEEDGDEILVHITAADFSKVSLGSIKDALVHLLYDLPGGDSVSVIKVDITGIENIDPRFHYLWETILKYQAMFGVGGLELICDSQEKRDRLKVTAHFSFLHPYFS